MHSHSLLTKNLDEEKSKHTGQRILAQQNGFGPAFGSTKWFWPSIFATVSTYAGG
jgi:hypothetical protein